MDFRLSEGDTLTQIQPDGSLVNINIVTDSKVYFGDTLNLKGYYSERWVWPRYKWGWCLFSPNVSLVYQDEFSDWWYTGWTDLNLIEYLNNNIDSITHKKHNRRADIQFEPIYLPTRYCHFKTKFYYISLLFTIIW